MKKLLLTFIISINVLAGLNAQAYKWWVGGRTMFWTGDEKTTFVIAPEVGYLLSPKFTLAASLGYQSYKDKSLVSSWRDYSGFVLNPYIRYTAFHKGMVLGFVDGGIDVGLGDLKGFQAGFKPGIAILLNDRFTAATQFGFIGYNDGKGIAERSKGIGFDFSGYCSTIAFFYSF